MPKCEFKGSRFFFFFAKSITRHSNEKWSKQLIKKNPGNLLKRAFNFAIEKNTFLSINRAFIKVFPLTYYSVRKKKKKKTRVLKFALGRSNSLWRASNFTIRSATIALPTLSYLKWNGRRELCSPARAQDNTFRRCWSRASLRPFKIFTRRTTARDVSTHALYTYAANTRVTILYGKINNDGRARALIAFRGRYD